MSNTRNRLREYFKQVEREYRVYQVAMRLGSHWAAHIATVDELDSLVIFKAYLADRFEWEDWFTADPDGEFNIAERWHFAVIDPQGCGMSSRLPVTPNRSAAIRFWMVNGRTSLRLVTAEFVRGFSDGALEVFERFKSSENE